MPNVAKSLMAIAAAGVAAVALPWLWAWAHLAAMGCVGNGIAAHRARGFDEETLLRLYREAESMAAAQRHRESLEFAVPGDRLPAAARAIGARYADVFGNDVLFNLSGCHDDKVFVQVTVGDDDRPPEISLSPGELQPGEVLWPKRAPHPKTP